MQAKLAVPTAVDAYIRVSRVNGREGSSFLSPTQQREAIENYARMHDLEIVTWHEEMDQSGKSDKRPKFNAMMERVRSGQTGGVIVAKLDRFSRSLSQGAKAIEELSKRGARFVAVANNVDPSTKDGRLMTNILLAMAEWELEGRTEGWQEVVIRKNGEGVHQGDVIGYTREKGRPLIIDEKVAPIIRELFERRAANASWVSLCEFMDASGLKPARAEKWSINTVTGIIPNKVYMGIATQGEHVHEKAHPAIVTPSLFAAANAVKGSAHAKTADYLLSGLCRCQGCRYKMMGAGEAKRPQYRRYRCRGRHGNGVCDTRARINADQLEAYVIEEAFAAHDVLMESTHRRLDIEALNQAVTDAEHELRAFMGIVKATDPFFGEGYRTRVTDVEQVKGERDRALVLYAPSGVTLMFRLRDEWEGMTVDERRAALKALIAYIIVKDGQAQIVWRGQEDALGSVPKTGAGQKGEPVRIIPFPWNPSLVLA